MFSLRLSDGIGRNFPLFLNILWTVSNLSDCSVSIGAAKLAFLLA